MPDDDTAAASEAHEGAARPAAAAAASPQPDTGYTESGVPTLDGVREKIETRYGAALGHTELAAETPEVRTAAEQFDARRQAAADKLAEIRESMRGPQSDGG